MVINSEAPMNPWQNPDSYEPEPESPHFQGVRQLSGIIIASVIVFVLLVYGIIRVATPM